MIGGVDCEASASLGRGNQTPSLIEADGVDSDPSSLGEFGDAKFHALTLRVIALKVER
jgi:hypothetical protein